ncbi:MAG: dTMP kinase [Alphaproteobacteria bacterium]|nr:dTMP kinase [Alphaproteobacteria bacterium]
MSVGLFVTFEGVDGSGKSTQARLLAEHLRKAGVEIVETREPGGSPGAEEIRRLLVEGEPGRWSPETEILLFNAARRDHLERTIEPALATNKTVICDRFADSTRVYQGAARAELREVVDTLHSLMIGREPDLTFVIDIDPAIALDRGLARNSGEDRFESLGLGFQQALRAGFLKLAADFPQRFIVVNGQRPVAEVAADIATHMAKRLS